MDVDNTTAVPDITVDKNDTSGNSTLFESFHLQDVSGIM